jgi:hypothetical protein
MELKDFKPSQVNPFARSYLPFVDAFRHSESEGFACMMICALVYHGDTWQPLSMKQIGEWLKHALHGPDDVWTPPPGWMPPGWMQPGKGSGKNFWQTMNENPFFRPHPALLIKEGFARFSGDSVTIEFTEQGMEQLAKWVR